jgi:hypothetical protein
MEHLRRLLVHDGDRGDLGGLDVERSVAEDGNDSTMYSPYYRAILSEAGCKES